MFMYDYDENYHEEEKATDYVDQNRFGVYDDDRYIERVEDGKVLHGSKL